jgi:copper homeostasis protein CutC
MPSAFDVKKLLKANGIMVYRVVGDSVTLAELVRDNLIMEAYVSVETCGSLRVRVATRAQRSDFPFSSETETSLLGRAREMGVPAVSLGFVEVQSHVESIPDPMDPIQQLDVWYQVFFEKAVDSDEDLLEAVHQAIDLEKVAPR